MIGLMNSDTFNLASLTAAINKLPFQPTRIGDMGLFEDDPIATTSLIVEEQDGVLTLIPNAQRGAPAKQAGSGSRKTRTFACTHLPYERTLRAEDVQGVRAFGSANALETLSQIVNNKLVEMKRSHSVTLEHLRIGALKGTILDSDGATVIYNLFTEFNVTQDSVDFVLGTATTEIKAKCLAVKRYIEAALGAQVYGGIHCFAGKSWFDAFTTHARVREAYDRYMDGQFLRDDNRKGFPFCGIFFEEYPGSVGSVSFVNDAEAHFFPVGVPGLYKNAYAPADFMETANTLGLPMYAKQEPMEFNRGVKIHTQSNPLPLCLRPKALVKGT
jgi:hypothetical protein